MPHKSSMRMTGRRTFSPGIAGHWIIRCAVVLVTVLAGYVIDRANYESYLDDTRQDVTQGLATVRTELEGTVSENMQTVRGLVAAIATEPDMNQERFAALASVILDDRDELRNIGAAPDMVVRLIHPLEKNRAALGLNFRENAEQWPEVKRAAESGKLVLAGPVNLVQGGAAFIGRVPVKLSARPGEPYRLWGLISVVIDIDTLFDKAGLTRVDHLTLALGKVEDNGEPGPILFGDADVFDRDPVEMRVNVPEGQWILAATPKGGWPSQAANAVALRMLLVAVGLLIVVPVLLLSWSMLRERVVQGRLRSLYELSPSGIGLYDFSEGRFIRCNDAFLRQSGYAAEHILALSIDDIVVEPLHVELQAQLEASGRFGPVDRQCRRQDGSQFLALITGALMAETRERTLAWLVIQDISERERVERMKSEFVSVVSHELRTPLTSIAGALKLVASGALGELPEKARPMIEIASQNGDRLTALINDLLDMDKLISGKIHVDMTFHALKPLLETALRQNQHYGQNAGVSLVLAACEETLEVNVDERRFLQVMANLLSNAIKFSPPSGQVTVSAVQRNGMVEISVKDEGPGVPQAFRETIFEKFTQVDSSDARQKGGTGLGLTITRGLVQMMSGQVVLADSPSGGALFVVTLPTVSSDHRIDNEGLSAE